MFYQLPEDYFKDTREAMHEVNMALRVSEHEQAINNDLNLLSFKCGFGTQYYRFERGSVVTATQVISESSDMYRTICKHEIILENALKELIRCIIRLGQTAMRARREQVQLLRHAEADPHDIATARCKYQPQLDEYKRFSKTMKLPEQMERVYTGRTGGRIAPSPQTYAKWQAEQINNAKERQEKKRREDMEAAQKTADHKKWLKDIGVTGTTLDTLDKYKEARHNNIEEYQLLREYSQAVKKGGISPLVGLDEYQRVAADVRARVVGTTTSDGVQIDSYTTHFIDQVIGQTADPHEGMREGVTVERVLEALQAENTTTRVIADGDMRGPTEAIERA